MYARCARGLSRLSQSPINQFEHPQCASAFGKSGFGVQGLGSRALNPKP